MSPTAAGLAAPGGGAGAWPSVRGGGDAGTPRLAGPGCPLPAARGAAAPACGIFPERASCGRCPTLTCRAAGACASVLQGFTAPRPAAKAAPQAPPQWCAGGQTTPPFPEEVELPQLCSPLQWARQPASGTPSESEQEKKPALSWGAQAAGSHCCG